jgi:ribosomal protein S17E
LEEANSKIKQHEKGKVKLEKLEELEKERDNIRKEFKISAENTFSQIHSTNKKCLWDILQQVVSVMETYQEYFKKGFEMTTETLNAMQLIAEEKVKERISTFIESINRKERKENLRKRRDGVILHLISHLQQDI